MINLRNVSFLMSVFILLSCGTEKKEEATTSAAPETLVGTWKLKQRINHQDGQTEWEDMTQTGILYDKHLTDTHFTWIQYDTNSDVLIGIGGGTYTYDGANYVENIEFFMPLFAGILGQSIDFTAEFKDGEWYHTGYTKEIEFDPELAEFVELDSNKVEEIWFKVDVPETPSGLMGTWELQEYKSQQDAPSLSYPDFVNYVKLITPTHFVWIQYNDEGDQVSGAGAGTYSYAGDVYKEGIQMMYPSGNALVGGEVVFKAEIDGDNWNHFCTAFERDGQSVDTVYIDEKWARYGSI